MIPLKDNIPTQRAPLVTLALIALNVIAYVLAIRGGGSWFGGPTAAVAVHYGAIPYAFTHTAEHCGLVRSTTDLARIPIECGRRVHGALPTWETAFASMFMHGGVLHLGGNMLFLWIFGNNVEGSMGHLRFLCFNLLGGFAALALDVAVTPASMAPMIGASGAIAAVLGGYILLFPRAKVLTVVVLIFFFTLIELPAVVMLGIWFAEQALFAAGGLVQPLGNGGGIAYYAHVGGFVFGLLLIKLFVQRQRPLPPALSA